MRIMVIVVLCHFKVDCLLRNKSWLSARKNLKKQNALGYCLLNNRLLFVLFFLLSF